MDKDGWLVVGGRREAKTCQQGTRYDGQLLTFDWNNGVAKDQLHEDTSGSLDSESERVDVDEGHHDVVRAFVTSEDSAVRDGLVGIDILGGFLSKVELLNLGIMS